MTPRGLRCLCAAASIALGVGSASTRAHAQPESADDPAMRDARERFREGVKRYEAKDFEGARIAFLQAYSVLHAVDILFNLAMSELRSARPVEALHHLQQYMLDRSTAEEERARAAKFLAEAHSKTGHVFIEAPDGAAVLMDDTALEKKAPIKDPVDVTVGKHVCTIRLDGKTQTVEVLAQAGQSVTVRFDTAGAPSVRVRSEPTRATGGEKPAGGTWSTDKTVTVIALGVGAVGAVAGGAVFFADAKSADSDALSATHDQLDCRKTPTLGPCPRILDLKDTYDRDRTVSMVLFAAGGVLGAGALAAAALWPNENAAPLKGTTLVPVVTAGGASILWSGRF